MPNKNNIMLKYNSGEKSMKIPDTIYLDFESVLEKISTCNNNSEKSSPTKICKHTSCGFSLYSYCSFDTTKNKLDYYRGKHCKKMFVKF